MAILGFVTLALLALMGFVLGLRFVFARSKRQELLRGASPFGGRLETTSFFELPRIRLWKRNFEVIIQFSESGGNIGSTTDYRIPWPDSVLRCALQRRKVVETIAPWMAEKPIDLAAPLLDDSYVVTGIDEPRIRRLFSARVQSAVLSLLALHVPESFDEPNIRFSIADGLCVITRSGHITDALALRNFILLCAELHDAALECAGGELAIASGVKESKSCA
jgi:hypothetical protein